MGKIVEYLLKGALVTGLILGGCGKNEGGLEDKLNHSNPIVRTINGIDYEINGNRLIQKTEDEDKTAKFGVISDPEGFYKNVEAFSKHFKQQKLDGIIMLGDYAQHFRKKPNPRLSDYDEITMCLENVAKTGLPIYVIPGNHEMRKDYERAMEQLSKKYKNVFDLSKIRIVDGDDFDFVSNPFGTDFTYLDESFKGSPEQIRKIGEYAKSLQKNDDPEILLTHQPPRCRGKYGIDVVHGGGHASDVRGVSRDNDGYGLLDKTMRKNKIKFSLSGHIHEAGGKGVTSNGRLVNPNTFSDDLRFNPGSAGPWRYLNGEVYNGMAGIITVENEKVKYETLSLN